MADEKLPVLMKCAFIVLVMMRRLVRSPVEMMEAEMLLRLAVMPFC